MGKDKGSETVIVPVNFLEKVPTYLSNNHGHIVFKIPKRIVIAVYHFKSVTHTKMEGKNAYFYNEKERGWLSL